MRLATRPVLWLFLQAAHDHGGERRWKIRPILGNRRRRLGDVRGQDLLRSRSEEGSHPREHLETNDTQRVDVCALIGARTAECLLRRHVGRGADREANRCDAGVTRGGTQRLGDAEIRYECVITGKENVLGFDIPMRHALLVCVLEGVGDVEEDPDGVTDRKLAGTLQSRAQRLAFDARHRVIQQVVVRAGEKERDDVGLLQSRRQLNLTAKALDVDACAELRRQDLYDDIATERDFADDEDARHSTAQILGDLVAVAERALKALGQISHRFLIQASSALEGRA